MSRLGIAAAALALALLTFFQFPGHTWLQQDSQIYIPVLENQYDSSILRNDILVQQSHVAYTLYDEVAVFLRRSTGLGFRELLAFQQIVTRALGIWGLYLIAQALGLSMAPALLVTLIVSLGARIPGPEVLTFEYEPTPRAFALPLLYCAIGLAAHRRYMAASIAAAVAFLYHFPAAAPFWLLFGAILVLRRTYLPLIPLAAATVILFAASRVQGGGLGLLSHIAPMQEQLQRMRTAYVWISLWPRFTILYHLVVAAIAAGAYLRLRSHIPFKLRLLIPGLAAIGLLSMPLSWLLLEHWKLSLAPQIQPMRWLLFATLAMQLLTAAAAVYVAGLGRWWEAIFWFAAAYLAPLQLMGSGSQIGRRIAVVLVLAACTALAKQFAPAMALIAFFLVPTVGRIVNYPQLHTPELGELSQWARDAAPRNAVFLFVDAGRGLQPGIFRSEALQAVYVDWKGGGQVNYLKEFADQWWFRWQQTMAKGFKPEDLPKYQALGIQYVVVGPQNALPQGPLFENGKYRVYRIGL